MEKNNFIDALNGAMQRDEDARLSEKICFKVPYAKDAIKAVLKHYLGEKAIYKPEYDVIADWLTDNKGKGLLMVGGTGTGKSFMGDYVIPTMLRYGTGQRLGCESITMDRLQNEYDIIKQMGIIYLDDVGNESKTSDYGNRHDRFAELVENAIRTNKILVVSTNLTVNELKERYNERIIDRLRDITVGVSFTGESLRGC